MHTQIELTDLLRRELNLSKEKNPRFSLRAMAKRLGVAPSLLSDTLAGKRRLTLKTAKRILDRIGVDPKMAVSILAKWEVLTRDKNQIQLKSNLKSEATTPVLNTDYLQLASDEYHVVSEWHYFAIYVLAESASFKNNPEWISERLQISTQKAKLGIARLERLGFLKQEHSNKLVPARGSVTTSRDIPSGAIRKRFTEGFAKAEEALVRLDVSERDFSNMMMAASPERMCEVKEKIERFRRELCSFLESDPRSERTEVFALDIQFYPISTPIQKGIKNAK